MHKWVGVGLVGVAGLALVGCGAIGLVSWAENHPEWLASAIAQAAGIPERDVSVGAWQMDLLAGTFELQGLRVVPPSANGLVVEIGRANGTLPHPLIFVRHDRIELGCVVIDGLVITQARQGPPRPYREPVREPISLHAALVTLTNGSFSAPADSGLPAVKVEGVRGVVHDFHWTPARRSYEGTASVRAQSLQLGAIEVGELTTDLVMRGDELLVGPTSLSFAGASALATGTVSNLRARPAVELRVIAGDQPLAQVIGTATGADSPVRGKVSVDVTLKAGGELPVGGSSFEGWLSASNTAVWLGEDPALPVKLGVSVAPWFRRLDDGWISVGDLQGQAAFGRGWVKLMQAERPDDEHRVLQAWGELSGADLTVLARIVPRRDASRAGVGVAVEGTVQRPALRLASADELLRAPEVWNQPVSAASAPDSSPSGPSASPSSPLASPPSPDDRQKRRERGERRRPHR